MKMHGETIKIILTLIKSSGHYMYLQV